MTHLLRIYQTVEPSCQAKCLVEDMNNDGLRRGKTTRCADTKFHRAAAELRGGKKNWKISLSRQRLARKEEVWGGRGERVARCSQHLPNNPPLVSFLAPMKSIISTLNHRVSRDKKTVFFFLDESTKNQPFLLTQSPIHVDTSSVPLPYFPNHMHTYVKSSCFVPLSIYVIIYPCICHISIYLFIYLSQKDRSLSFKKKIGWKETSKNNLWN